MNTGKLENKSLNLSKKHKHVWIVSASAFEFGWMGSTQRLLSIANAFQQIGYKVSLFAGRHTNGVIQAEIDRLFPGKIFRANQVGPYGKFLSKTAFRRKAYRGYLRLTGHNNYWSSISFGLGKSIDDNTIEVARNTVGTPGLVWAMCGGLLESAIVGERVAKYFDCPWFFELHDPPLFAGLGEPIGKVEKEFEKLVNNSTAVITNSVIYNEKLSNDYRNLNKFLNLYLSFNGEPKYHFENLSSNLFVIGHFGSLNSPRCIIPLLKAIKELKAENYKYFDNIRILIAGVGNGIEKALTYARKYLSSDTLEYVGELDKKYVEQYMLKCDCITIIQPESFHYEIPGKLFETFKTLKPILALVNPGSETAAIVDNYPLGFVCASTDIDGIKSYLKLNVPKSPVSEDTLCAAKGYINEFTFNAMKDKLQFIINSKS